MIFKVIVLSLLMYFSTIPISIGAEEPAVVTIEETAGSVPDFDYSILDREEKLIIDIKDNIISVQDLTLYLEDAYLVSDGICIADKDDLSSVGVPYKTEYKFYATVYRGSIEAFDFDDYDWYISEKTEQTFMGYAHDLRDEYDGQLGKPFYYILIERDDILYEFYFSVDSELKRVSEDSYNRLKTAIEGVFNLKIDSYENFLVNLAL